MTSNTTIEKNSIVYLRTSQKYEKYPDYIAWIQYLIFGWEILSM